MAFVSVTTLGAGSKGGRRPSANGEKLVFATDKATRNGEKYASIRFRISAQLAEEARLKDGDRMDVLFDAENRLGLITRVKNGPFCLSHRTGLKKGDEPKNTTPFSIKFTWKPGMPWITKSDACTDVRDTPDGIMFNLPDGATFESTPIKEQ